MFGKEFVLKIFFLEERIRFLFDIILIIIEILEFGIRKVKIIRYF